jgi:DmsE family decaheme c-type cytochrome
LLRLDRTLGSQQDPTMRHALRASLSRAGMAALILAGAVWGGQAFAQPTPARTQALERACRVCHSDKFSALATTPHGVIDGLEYRGLTGNAPGCLNCHGDVSAHVGAGGGRGNIFAFHDQAPMAINDVCLGCHADDHPAFDTSPHARGGLSCVDCHTQHGATSPARALLRLPPPAAGALLGRVGTSSALCADCHQDVLAAFDFNERHRLREGALECVSCHDPHAMPTRSLLGGFKQEQCIDCHEDKGGPFVFEHPASRVEGCTACHTPHGSPNRHLLATQRVAELCIGCHATVPQFHLGFNPAAPPRFNLGTQCTNCHSSIHGSNFDSHFLR